MCNGTGVKKKNIKPLGEISDFTVCCFQTQAVFNIQFDLSDSDVNVKGFSAAEEAVSISDLGIKDGDQLLAKDCKEKG